MKEQCSLATFKLWDKMALILSSIYMTYIVKFLCTLFWVVSDLKLFWQNPQKLWPLALLIPILFSRPLINSNVCITWLPEEGYKCTK